MGKCISHITRKEWYRNCNKGCMLCFGYNCDMCGADISDGARRCAEVACFFCSFSCCVCECRCIKDSCAALSRSIQPICLCTSRVCQKTMKFISNECDDMCECSCYCENPCIFRDNNTISLQTYIDKNYYQKTPFHSDPVFADNFCVAQHKQSLDIVSVKVLEFSNENQFLQADAAFRKHFESDTNDNFTQISLRHVLFFDFLAIDLHSELSARRQSQTHFTFPELINLIHSTLSALSYFQSIGISHESLRSSRIFAASNGTFKIADPALFHHSLNYDDAKLAYDSFTMNATANDDPIYLSPDMFKRIANKDEYYRQQTYESRTKGIAFTLGMIFLSAMSLDSLSTIYDYEEATIDFDAIKQLLNQSHQRLKSDILSLLISNLLDINPVSRFDFQKAFSFIESSLAYQISHARLNSPKPVSAQIDGYAVNFGLADMNGTDRMRIDEIGSLIQPPQRPSFFDRTYSCTKSVTSKCIGLCKKQHNEQENVAISLKEVEPNQEGELFDKYNRIIYKGQLLNKSIKHGTGTQYFFPSRNSQSSDQLAGSLRQSNTSLTMHGYDHTNRDILKHATQLQGSFKNDLKNGKATLTYENNHKLNVNYINDFIHGEATYTTPDNVTIFTAVFKRNKIQDIKYSQAQAPPQAQQQQQLQSEIVPTPILPNQELEQQHNQQQQIDDGTQNLMPFESSHSLIHIATPRELASGNNLDGFHEYHYQ